MTSILRCSIRRFFRPLTKRCGLCVFLSVIAGVACPVFSHAQQSALRSAATAQIERVEVTTDTLKVTFDLEGGSVVRTEFLKTPSSVKLPKNLVLLDDSRDRVYLAQTGLIGLANGAFPTHKTPMSFSGERFMKDGQSEFVVTFESPVVNGVKLIKTYAFQRGSYVVSVRHTALNVGTVPVAPLLYLQLVRDGNKEALDQKSIYATFTGPAIYSAGKKYQRVEFHEIDTNLVDIERSSPYGYVAMVQHYFASAWLLGDGIDRDFYVRKVDSNLYSVGMITKLKDIVPGASATVDARLFVGPRVATITTPLRLEAMQDDGWLINLLQKLKT
jgi:YidC/Oxa1 family membrane protein insertase